MWRCHPGSSQIPCHEPTRNISSHDVFRQTAHYLSLPAAVRSDFEQFISEVSFAFRKHPRNPKRTFYWGDSLDPGFLETIGLKHLEPAVEQALRVRFP